MYREGVGAGGGVVDSGRDGACDGVGGDGDGDGGGDGKVEGGGGGVGVLDGGGGGNGRICRIAVRCSCTECRFGFSCTLAEGRPRFL